MYGELMEKPYVFTNVGGDTLYLNGVPYYPIRGPRSVAERYPEIVKGHPELFEGIEEKAKREHAFDDSVGKLVDAMHDSGASYEDCLDSLAAMYDRSPFVIRGTVRKLGNGIDMVEVDGNERSIILSFEPSPPLRTPEEIHKDLMEEFWSTVRRGTMIARGYGGYFLTSPRPDMEKMKRLINRLAAGDTLSAEDMTGTPLVFKAFREDVSKRAVRRKPKEER
jgi:hypothetical protein